MRWRAGLAGIFHSLTDLVYPEICEVCGRTLSPAESLMCGSCRRGMPFCGFAGEDTPLHVRLFCRQPLHRAASYFRYYSGDPYTSLIRNAKYHGRPYLMERLGEEFAGQLADRGFFDGMDVVLPVPMHVLRRLGRGFNQTEYLARGVARASGLTPGDNLLMLRRHRSQTLSGGSPGRARNVSGIFGLRRPEDLNGLGLLIVDDVVTTGATLRTLMESIADVSSPRSVSVLTLGFVPDV